MASTNDAWKEKLIEDVWLKIPNLEGVLIIDTHGNVLENKISKKLEKSEDITWLKNIAKKVSGRFGFDGFDKELEGLRMTINVFARHIMISRPIRESKNLLILIMPLSNDIWNHMVSVSTIDDLELK